METLPEVAQMLDLPGKTLKSAIKNIFNKLKESMPKERKESIIAIAHQQKVSIKEIEII